MSWKNVFLGALGRRRPHEKLLAVPFRKLALLPRAIGAECLERMEGLGIDLSSHDEFNLCASRGERGHDRSLRATSFLARYEVEERIRRARPSAAFRFCGT